MRSLFYLAIVSVVGLAANADAQQPKAKPEKENLTKATYLVTGLH